MKNKNILLNHYDVLIAFSQMYYKDLITKNDLGDETIIKGPDGKQLFIYPVKYKGKLYAIPSKIVEAGNMPIKITDSDKIGYRSYVYHIVKEFASAKIGKEHTMNFRTLIDTIANFNHDSKDEDYLIYKIAVMTLYMRKGFMRVVSEAAFGKNSVPQILKILMTDIAIANPKSLPALEHKLRNKLVVLDELTNLEKNHRSSMQDALLQIADGSPSYEKATRASAKFGTKDEYDISKLSIAVLYNVYEYYVEAGQGDKYFDNVFTKAVKSRFLPLYFDGVLNAEQFVDVPNPKEIATVLFDDIRKIIKAIKYFQEHFEDECNKKDFKLYKKYKLSKEGRIEKTFNTICQGFKLYAKDEIEYNRMADKLEKSYKKYIDMMNIGEIEEVPLEGPIKAKERQEDIGSFFK